MQFLTRSIHQFLSGAADYSDIFSLVSYMVKTVLTHMKISPDLKLLLGSSAG